MSKQGILLKDKGYIFGLGAFRRYKEVTGEDLAHFEEALKPVFEVDKHGNIVEDDEGNPVRIRGIDDVEANYRWAVMLKCANDIHCDVNNSEKTSVASFTVLLDNAEQSESNDLLKQYLDSSYMGKPMRDYYGIPSPREEAKKKPTARAKRIVKP
ncbi:hypothetical protein ORI89_18825 [Sphingobacterium sp. UT-1RO-CII-1]|uniref:hypothetical protein n=1 Tax=Sphingobacterium sp. UT-1RO-CII-1 TaxID=2995225 RepID=UPI00227CAA35|nr:hypothetical protein [Sphingobacterium sp. UT-1RO-CII-1]MCY4781712.1 hypothetical protein [Sphingobacterium sp. UT-1RO-CII-1]